MAKINDKTTFPNTTPGVDDHVIGTDISDTGNSADGEVVTFVLSDIVEQFGFLFSWHPYDMVTADDGADGIIYDNSVDGDTGNVVTPVFEDGYEYRLIGSDLSHDGGVTNYAFYFEMYLATGGSYTEAAVSRTTTSAGSAHFDVIIHSPRLQQGAHLISGVYRIAGGAISNYHTLIGGHEDTSQKIDKVRLRMNEPGTLNFANIDAGKVRMLRRKLLV